MIFMDSELFLICAYADLYTIRRIFLLLFFAFRTFLYVSDDLKEDLRKYFLRSSHLTHANAFIDVR